MISNFALLKENWKSFLIYNCLLIFANWVAWTGDDFMWAGQYLLHYPLSKFGDWIIDKDILCQNCIGQLISLDLGTFTRVYSVLSSFVLGNIQLFLAIFLYRYFIRKWQK
jgi:hypothetical protein